MRCLCACAILLASALFAAEPAAEPADKGLSSRPVKELEGIGITEHLGQMLPLDVPFVDDSKQPVTLRKYFTGKKPVLLSLVYFRCPMLCNLILNGEAEGIKQVKLTAGTDYECVVVSFDPLETPELAAANKERFLELYARPGAGQGVHFLTGNKESIQKLAGAVGFGFRWDEQQKQYAHQAAIYAVSPDGKLSRYLYGIEFDPQMLRLSLVEAGEGKVGSFSDRIVLFCYHFDPSGKKYTLQAWRVMQVAALLTAVLVAGAIGMFFMWERSRRQSSEPAPGSTETPQPRGAEDKGNA